MNKSTMEHTESLISDEVSKEKNAIVESSIYIFGISKEDRNRLIEIISSGEPSFVLQKELDSVFSAERQNQLVQTASEDCKGRKVRYYRYISREKLITLLEKGEQVALDYYDSDFSEEDFETLQFFLFDYCREVLGEEIEFSDELPIEAVLFKVFGRIADIQVISEVFLNTETRNWPAILEFIRENVDPLFVRSAHTGGTWSGQKFSDHLSLSVGGPMRSGLGKDTFYLELVMPDEEVIPHPQVRITGEREVFTKRIGVEQISRIYGFGHQMELDLTDNESTAPGSYYVENTLPSFALDKFDHWRWSVPIKETVPLIFKPLYDAEDEKKQAEAALLKEEFSKKIIEENHL